MQTKQDFQLSTSRLTGRNLLEASAGTGKTYTIAALYLRLLLETDLPVDKILVVTFTDAATEELRDRIRRKISLACSVFQGQKSEDGFVEELAENIKTDEGRNRAAQKLREALICFDEAAIYTIHGFCQRILQDRAFEAGSLFDTELITNQVLLLEEIAQDFWRKECGTREGLFAAYLVEQNITPATFTRMTGPLAGNPDIKVLPEWTSEESNFLENSWVSEKKHLESLWQKARPEIESLLRDNEALSRNKYKSDNLDQWLTAIDGFLASHSVFKAPEPLFKYLTSSALAAGTKKNHTPPQHSFFEACESASQVYERLVEHYQRLMKALTIDFANYLKRELPRRKKLQNIRHFDDLLLDVRERLLGQGGQRLCESIRSQFMAAFIDEFQDTDPVQFAIFRILYPDDRRPVFFIGDPKQAIYSFRGADIFSYIQATQYVDHHYTLGKNWRSSPDLVKAVNILFDSHPRPFVFSEIPFQPVNAKEQTPEHSLRINRQPDRSPLLFWNMEPTEPGQPDNLDISRQRLADAVSHEIVRLLSLSANGAATLDSRPLEAADIAVLVRTHKEGALIEQSLKNHGIPSIQSATGSLFETREAQEVMRFLKAAADPANESLVKAALAGDLFGYSGSYLATMNHDPDLLEKWLETFLEYNHIWQNHGVFSLTGKLFSEQKVRQRVLEVDDGQRRLTNLLHCFEVLHKSAQEQHFGIDGLLKWFARQFEEERDREEYQVRLETDDKAVQIVTIHKSKGLEYPIVFCPFCWNTTRTNNSAPLLFHHPGLDNRLTMDLGSDEFDQHRSLVEREYLAEQMRLLYVAITRAKYRCYIGWGELKYAEHSSLAYLLHSPDQNCDQNGSEMFVDYPSDLSLATIQMDLDRLVEASDGLITVASIPEPSPAEGPPAIKPESHPLKPHQFIRKIDRSWCISSFTHLTFGSTKPHQTHQLETVWTIDESNTPGKDVTEPDFLSFMDFPKGATAGTLLHSIFEKLDFTKIDTEAAEQIVRSEFLTYDFDPQWTSAVIAMIRNTLAKPLFTPEEDSFCLSQIPAEDCLAEMEFMFPIGPIDSGSICHVLSRHASSQDLMHGYPANLSKLGFAPHHGILHGFIDLVFRYKGRYYLVDWKSNHLGEQQDSYRAGELKKAMISDHYILQYHLYLVALHRHLVKTVRDYSYQNHFGGVIYAFLRGTALAETSNSSLGFYVDRPSISLVEDLGNYLKTGKVAI